MNVPFSSPCPLFLPLSPFPPRLRGRSASERRVGSKVMGGVGRRIEARRTRCSTRLRRHEVKSEYKVLPAAAAGELVRFADNRMGDDPGGRTGSLRCMMNATTSGEFGNQMRVVVKQMGYCLLAI